MTTYPWRFQADLKLEDPNPDVTVFVGDVVVNSTTGERTVHQDTSNPEIVKLADLSSYITTGMTEGITRTEDANPRAAKRAKRV